MDPHDISYSFRFESPRAAAASVEGYDAHDLEYFGADGTVYRATVEGPKWGTVTLHPTPETRLDELLARLGQLAEWQGTALPFDLPRDPEQVWARIHARHPPMRP